MKFYGASKTGPVRSSNQDSFFARHLSSDVFIAAVCDGMGGAAAGEIASKTAVKVISQELSTALSVEPESDFDWKSEIIKAFSDADDSIRELTVKNPEYLGMGTTAVLIAAYKDNAYIANVGDSRCYKINNEKLFRLTKDHSYVQMLVDKGQITEQEAETHPNKNIITRSVGGSVKAYPDLTFEKAEGVFLLCSDGLTNYLSETQIFDIIIKATTPQKAVSKLISEAIKNGGGDNVTALIVDFSK